MSVFKGTEKILIKKGHKGRKKLDMFVLLRDAIVVWVKSKMSKLII
jgi:hypothetical protein